MAVANGKEWYFGAGRKPGSRNRPKVNSAAAPAVADVKDTFAAVAKELAAQAGQCLDLLACSSKACKALRVCSEGSSIERE